MSEQPQSALPMAAGQLRTLAVRISEDLRAQLDIIAQLTGRSATEEIRLALEYWIEKIKSDPAMLQKAQQVQTEIERKARTQRSAIDAIFGGKKAAHDGTRANQTKMSTPPGSDTGEDQAGDTTTEAPNSPRSTTRRGKQSSE
jgi:predicted DNA-binding protein